MSPPPSVRVFIAGASGSGKSTVAWRYYLQRYPRRILLDTTGEWSDPGGPSGGQADATVWTVREFSQALRQLAPRGRWTIVANLEDVEELVAYLAPASELRSSPIVTVGGAVILVDEVDIVAPPKTSRTEVRMLWRRSRHLGLSIVATTQRPENCNREVTSQSPQVLCLQLVEPAAWDYMSDIMRLDLAPLQAWTARHPHGGLWVETRTGEVRWLSEAGHWLRPQTVLLPKAGAVPGSVSGARVVTGASVLPGPAGLPAPGDGSRSAG